MTDITTVYQYTQQDVLDAWLARTRSREWVVEATDTVEDERELMAHYEHGKTILEQAYIVYTSDYPAGAGNAHPLESTVAPIVVIDYGYVATSRQLRKITLHQRKQQ